MNNAEAEGFFRSREKNIAGSSYMVDRDDGVHMCMTMLGHGIWYFKHYRDGDPNYRRELNTALMRPDTVFEER